MGEPLNWITDAKIPIGPWAKSFVDWLTTNADWFFNQLAFLLSHVIDALLFVLQTPNPLIVIVAIGALAWWLRRSITVAVFTCLGLLLIMNQGYWKETTETLALVLASTFVSMIVGIPLGIAAARRAWVYSVLRPVLDLMQTIPTFVYLIPALILFGLGMVPGLIATVIFAIPAPIRLTRLGIISTPPSLVEAAESFGATPMQVLQKGRTSLRHAADHGGSDADHHAVAVDGGHRCARWCRRARRAGGAGTQYCERRQGLRSRSLHRHPGDHSRPHVPHRG